MPTTFHDREQAFEAKFAHDQAFRFLLLARRDKLFARWAAAIQGWSSEETDQLVKTVIAIPDGHRRDQALLRHIAGILAKNGGNFEGDLQKVLDGCMEDASRQLTKNSSHLSELL